jgi:arylsulfatase A-like enzyme
VGGKVDNWSSPFNFRKITLNREEENTEEVRPNILLIITDQQSINAMSVSGNPYIQTPNMDALAEHGIRFTKSYSTFPESSASRSSIVTGRMPHLTGVMFNEQIPDSNLLTMGEIFKEAGYQTTWAGKWHLPEQFPHTSIQEASGFRFLNFLPAEKMTARGDVADTPLADGVVKYLKGRKKEPFLLVVSFQNPRDISALPAKPTAFPFPANIASAPPIPSNHEISSSEPHFIKDCRKQNSYSNETFLASSFRENDWRNYLHHYYRRVENVDEEIGKILAILEKESLDQNTLIIYTSTYGDGSAAHKWAGRQSLYQEIVQVPFIITQFGKNPTNVVNNRHLVSGIDILPTMLDYAGMQIPDELNGKSIRQIIDNPDTTWRNYIVSQIAPFPDKPAKQGRMISDGRYKYMVYSEGQPNEQLFELINDPGEKTNLVYSPVHSAAKEALKKALISWTKENQDPFTF